MTATSDEKGALAQGIVAKAADTGNQGAAHMKRPGFRPSRVWLYLLPALIFLALFFVGPLAAMIWQSLHVKAGGFVQPGLS